MEQIILISLLSGLATGIGGLIVLWFGRPDSRVLGFYLGISTGMMGMVVFVDLLPASFTYGNIKYTWIGLLIGILIMSLVDWFIAKFLPLSNHLNQIAEERYYRQLAIFFTLAIALHNLPEGVAIGAGFETQEKLGIRVALVIALHNIPEGLGVASTLMLSKLRSLTIFLIPLSTGLFIPLGTWISILIGEMVPYWISIGLSVAAGAMGYLVVKDIGPESMKLHRLLGQFGMGIGILIMYIVYQLNH
ncbi:ZIP family metal transporter [Tepidibacillus infernus]|uniref:ZIP family metal transporter n=1 Tax=Tepidibacillus infernus TaxID=1806172 RepID=UPI003B6EA4C3